MESVKKQVKEPVPCVARMLGRFKAVYKHTSAAHFQVAKSSGVFLDGFSAIAVDVISRRQKPTIWLNLPQAFTHTHHRCVCVKALRHEGFTHANDLHNCVKACVPHGDTKLILPPVQGSLARS